MKIKSLFKKNKHKRFLNDYKIIEKEFDAEFYLNENPDLAAGRNDPIIHYLEHGSSEGRRPARDFDPHFYLRQYGEKVGKTEPFVHYLTIGRAIGFRGAELDFHYSQQLVYPNGVVPSRRPLNHEDYALASAFQNVADALRALQADAKAVAAAEAAEQATGKSLELIRKQYTAGAVNSTQVLIAQQGYLSALITSAGARATQYADTAALFVALGGGWWNRNDVAPAPPETDPLKFL